jgi:uncharacterized membrane protein HdeD (DUF308 family)
MANGEEKKKKKDKTKSTITAGFIMVGIGVVFLLSNLNIIPDLDEMWPLILIIVGTALLIGALRDKKAAESTGPMTPTEPAPPPPLG